MSLFFFIIFFNLIAGNNINWEKLADEVDEDFESTAQFNDDGVLMYCEWKYDGDPIIILELQGKFFYEYWEIIMGVAIAGVVVIVLVVVLLKRKK